MATLQFNVYWIGQKEPDTFKITPKSQEKELDLMRGLRAFNGDYLTVTDDDMVLRCIHTSSPKFKEFTVEEYVEEKKE